MSEHQAVAGLSIESQGPFQQRLEVQAGWSVIGQYALTPANLRTPGSRVFDFDPVRNARIERPLADIVAAVTAARAALIPT